MKTQNKREIKNENRRTRKIHKKENGGGMFSFLTSNKNTSTEQKMNYPIITPNYNGKNIQCEVCQQSEYYKINASIDRSKTATIIFGNDLVDIASHPVKMYICTNCHNCKFVYSPTRWNGLIDKIMENPVAPQMVEGQKNQVQPAQSAQPAQPAQPVQN